MSLFYKLAYALGFTPWENAATHRPAAEQISALFDREQAERSPPYGRALDLGCGTGHWAFDLASRGWQVTGIDIVGSAVSKARVRAKDAGIEVRFIKGDVTALRAAGIRPSFQFIWDFGTVHGLTPSQRRAVGREVTAVTEPGATMLILAWAPGRRSPLPRGASRADIEMAFPSWAIIDAVAFDVSGLPPPLRRVEPTCYRLRRA
jgi:SAM-dependent methyltransferase